MPFKSYTLDTEGTQEVCTTPPPSLSTVSYYSCNFHESNYAIPSRECRATFSYLLICFVPQFTEATDIITLESVRFPMRFCVYIENSLSRHFVYIYFVYYDFPC